MKKVAVIFPGIGYNKDRPLLYYSARLAQKAGYELVWVDFSGMEWDKSILDDRKKMLVFLDIALKRANSLLDTGCLLDADKIVFISKSIGTVVASAYGLKHVQDIRHIYFSPLEMIASFAPDGHGYAFYGDDDPFADCKKIETICREKHIKSYVVNGGNHSLETADPLNSISELSKMMDIVNEILCEVDFYDIEVLTADGLMVPLSEYRGKVLMIVNTATGCGFTPQYSQIEELYRKYKKDGFEVLDFPCNQFGRQAPGTDAEIHSFCTSQYDISFRQYAKINVNGNDETMLYRYLKEKQGFKGFAGGSPLSAYLEKAVLRDDPDYRSNDDIKWNFTKFLIDRSGKVTERFEPDADMAQVENAIKKLL